MAEKRMGEHALPPLVLPQVLTAESNRAMSEWMLQIEDARTERAAVVAWLRRMQEREAPWPAGMDNDAYNAEVMCMIADAIERGAHREG